MIDIIKPNWPATEHVHAYTTTRLGGYSEAPFESLNLATHTGDNQETVLTNRMLLKEALDLPSEPFWLEQIHSDKIVCIDSQPSTLIADGSFARTHNRICTVLTADCLPVLITNPEGTLVSALHAGWRGLLEGIIEEGVKILHRFSDELLVWLGPAIGPKAFEVGSEVRDQFIAKEPAFEKAFIAVSNDKWLVDIYSLAKIVLLKMGVTAIYGGDYCTYSDPKRFYSYRRDGETGRMASLIWFAEVF